jgi:hypothetical protein
MLTNTQNSQYDFPHERYMLRSSKLFACIWTSEKAKPEQL